MSINLYDYTDKSENKNDGYGKYSIEDIASQPDKTIYVSYVTVEKAKRLHSNYTLYKTAQEIPEINCIKFLLQEINDKESIIFPEIWFQKNRKTQLKTQDLFKAYDAIKSSDSRLGKALKSHLEDRINNEILHDSKIKAGDDFFDLIYNDKRNSVNNAARLIIEASGSSKDKKIDVPKTSGITEDEFQKSISMLRDHSPHFKERYNQINSEITRQQVSKFSPLSIFYKAYNYLTGRSKKAKNALSKKSSWIEKAGLQLDTEDKKSSFTSREQERKGLSQDISKL